jgi:tetratricopeptide (TPR) repeat protein
VRRGEFAAALERVDTGFRKWGDRLDTVSGWRFRVVKAEALDAQGQAAVALHLLEPKPPARREFGDLAVRRLVVQAAAGLELRQIERARILLEEAGRLAAASGSRSLALTVQYRTGLLLIYQGEYEAADGRLREALESAKRQGDHYMEAGAVGGLCFSLVRRARYDEALPWCERSAALARRLGARVHEAAATGNMGRCYWGLGDYERAEALLSQAVDLSTRMNDRRRRQIWLRALGDVALEARRDYAGATRLFEQALALSRQTGRKEVTAGLHNRLAAVALYSGDLAAAERHSREALELSKDSRYRSLVTAARFWAAKVSAARGDLAGAEAAFRETLGASSESEDREILWQVHAELAKLYAAAHKPGAAGREYETALAALERIRARLPRDEWKLSFQAGSRGFYSDYVAFLMDGGQTAHALEVVEWSRARVLAQNLGVLDGVSHIRTVADFRAIARRRRTALVSLWLGPARSYAWVVTSKGVTWAALPGEAEFNTWVTAFQAAIQGLRDPLEDGNPAARRLSEALLAPLGVPRGSRVILVPDGALHQLNFEALPAPSGPPRYWIEDATVEIAPSLALLDAGAAARRRGGATLLLIGAPIPSRDFGPLPGVEAEVAAVAGRFRAPVVLTGGAAYPGAYREAQPGRFEFLHFAAHAVANRESPLDSAVILSPHGESSKLYARDVLGLPLSARLVTISACRGAGSRVYSGEGLVGFVWAFLQAGARNVIAGLWDVNDRSTALLMDRLYAEMAAGRPPAAALRTAKLELLASPAAYRKPYYWAGFQVFTRFSE